MYSYSMPSTEATDKLIPKTPAKPAPNLGANLPTDTPVRSFGEATDKPAACKEPTDVQHRCDIRSYKTAK